ncbi:MAG: hypothetical protein JWM81_514 [Candidatus Saccharibacteria bacterium]|nr:hypothetical protein [Candidatus Saccharibacteria bacterium]
MKSANGLIFELASTSNLGLLRIDRLLKKL